MPDGTFQEVRIYINPTRSLLFNIISIQIISQLTDQSFDIEPETISAYFAHFDRFNRSINTLQVYEQSTTGDMPDQTDDFSVKPPQNGNNLEGSPGPKPAPEDSNSPKKVNKPKESVERNAPENSSAITAEHQALQNDSKFREADGKPKSAKPEIPVRVGLARRDGGVIQSGANEVFLLPFEFNSRRDLINTLRGKFSELEQMSNSRMNVPDRCFWGQGYDVEHLRLNWNPLNASYANSWDQDVSGIKGQEVEITDFNHEACLKAIEKSSTSACALSILISRRVPSDRNTI